MRFENVNRVLLLVPHQDDEIAIAGACIWYLTHQGKEVFVCYSTNGDYEIDVDVRYQEACEALALLGVSKDHIIMLGYPDTSNEDGFAHIFYCRDEKPLYSKAGRDHTYGGKSFSDYAFEVFGEHHPYTYHYYYTDVKSVISRLLPEFLICVDMDHHVDHRMLSLTFEKVMGEILKENPDYCPKVWKAFAYGTNFSADRDYWQINLDKTQYPQTRLRENEGKLDNPFYDWNKRVRISVNPTLYTFPIEYGIIYKTLEKHHSQMAILFAETTINCDQVFWERRTDSLFLRAVFTASSGDVASLNDFLLFDVSQIHEVEYIQMKDFWKPNKEDSKKEIQITLPQKESIEYLSIWGIGSEVEISLQYEEHILKKDVQTFCGEIRFEFEQPVCTDSMKLVFRFDEKKEFGIGEIEAYKPTKIYNELFKILMDDLMVDTYYSCFHCPSLSIYEYNEYNLQSKTPKMSFMLNGKRVRSLQEIRKLRYALKKKIVVKAFLENEQNSSDTITICHIEPLALLFRRRRYKKWISSFEIVKKRIKEEHYAKKINQMVQN